MKEMFTSPKDQHTALINYVPGVNDDHASVTDTPSSTAGGPKGDDGTVVNADLTLCNAVSKKLRVKSCEFLTVDQAQTIITTKNKFTKLSYKNDAVRHFASFVFFCTMTFKSNARSFIKRLSRQPSLTIAFAIANLFFITAASGQGTLGRWEMCGLSGTTTTVSPTGVTANVIFSDLSRGGGLSAASATDAYTSSGFSTSNFLNTGSNDYYEFTITPDPGYLLSISTIKIRDRKSTNSSSFDAYLRFSDDNYSNNVIASWLPSTTLTNRTLNVTGVAELQNRASAVTFRIYGSDANSGADTYGFFCEGTSAGNFRGIDLDGTVNQLTSPFNFNSSGTFVVPPNVTSVTVQAWGGGGGGGADGGAGNGAGGGGGGAYASSVVPVTPGQTINVTVGAGGNATNAGGPSSFGSSVIALGGSSTNTTTGGAGGSAAGSTGQVKFTGGSGGDGGSGAGNGGGGGGSSASISGIGIAGGSFSGSSGGTGGDGPDGDGGQGGTGSNAVGGGSSGLAGTEPGGGGGGRGDNGGNSAPGANGRVIVSWVTCSVTLSSPDNSDDQAVCPGTAIADITYSITGASDATVSGLPDNVDFNYDNGTLTISGSPTESGNFSYTVVPNSPCSGVTATGTITVHPKPTAGVTDFTNLTCFGANDGTITVSASGGIPPYLYSIDNGLHWTPIVTNPHVFTGLSANQPYGPRVEDSNGCRSKPVQ